MDCPEHKQAALRGGLHMAALVSPNPMRDVTSAYCTPPLDLLMRIIALIRHTLKAVDSMFPRILRDGGIRLWIHVAVSMWTFAKGRLVIVRIKSRGSIPYEPVKIPWQFGAECNGFDMIEKCSVDHCCEQL